MKVSPEVAARLEKVCKFIVSEYRRVGYVQDDENAPREFPEEKGEAMKGQLRIEHCYAFVVVDKDGTEGIPAMLVASPGTMQPYPMMLPLMGADMTRVDDLKRLIKDDPMLKGLKITLVKFSHREELEVIET